MSAERPGGTKARRIDPRVLAPIAFLAAALAVGIELIYTIANYVQTAFHELPFGR